MQGSEFIYVPVEANEVMPMAEGDSGGDIPGFEVPGSYINWDRERGIVNDGWDRVLEIENNPFSYAGYTTVEQIQEVIDSQGNLNTIFSSWGQYIMPNELSAFIEDITAAYGVYKPSRDEYDGCIGDRIY